MNDTRMLLDAFNIYYSKGIKAVEEKDFDSAIRNITQAAVTMYKLAKASKTPLKEQRIQKADNLTEYVEKIKKIQKTPSRSNQIGESEKVTKSIVVQENEEIGLEEALDKLYKLEGLSRVKEEVRSLVDEVRVNEARQKSGLCSNRSSHHMVFLGNPGTGKTTVARILGQIFHALGILSKGHFIEVSRPDLVGAYIGQTEQITKDVIEQAKGGILFIDEAYSLKRCDGVDNDYGQVAIDIFNKEMEDNRDDLVIIAAGYEDQMEIFLNSNPGLKSRFANFLHFDDYSSKELYNIFNKMVEDCDYVLTKDANNAVFNYINNQKENALFSGNARDMRNLLDSIKRPMNNRLAEIIKTRHPTVEELRTIEVEDLPFDPDTNERRSVQKTKETEPSKKDVYEPERTLLNNVVDNSEFRFDWDSLPNVTFDEIAGLEDVKEAVKTKVLLPLEHPEAFDGYAKKNGGGLFLYGPPGTGKTMIAAAIANEIGAKFCAVKPSDLLHQGAGNTEKAVKALFAQARQNPCSVIYFDEMDSIAQKNTKSTYSRQLRSELLAQIQGIDSYRDNKDHILFLIGATNRPWDVDSAFVRPGRFGTRVYVGLPNKEAISYIINKRLNKVKDLGIVNINDDINIDEIVEKCNGFNGSDVANLLDRVEEISAVRAVECKEKYICKDDFDRALLEITSSVQIGDIEKIMLWKEQNNG